MSRLSTISAYFEDFGSFSRVFGLFWLNIRGFVPVSAHFGPVLSIFRLNFRGFGPVAAFFSYFRACFGPISAHFHGFWACLGPFGSYSTDFWPILAHFGPVLAHFGPTSSHFQGFGPFLVHRCPEPLYPELPKQVQKCSKSAK